ncbi:putative uncharacterized protein [Pseudomonas sp. StFLB209]|nr:putative uncharacterized protein [Pseudomonas sp. StFLB209]
MNVKVRVSPAKKSDAGYLFLASDNEVAPDKSLTAAQPADNANAGDTENTVQRPTANPTQSCLENTLLIVHLHIVNILVGIGAVLLDFKIYRVGRLACTEARPEAYGHV